jgi:uncharacterized DUF497 family protein
VNSEERALLSRGGPFEWDENKRQSNVAKHGIDFVDAKEVFLDPQQFTYRSPNRSGELRYVTVGKSQGLLLAVISTPREDKLRIISARMARRNERDQYG